MAVEGHLMTVPEAMPHLIAASVFGRSLLQVKVSTVLCYVWYLR